MNLSVKRKQCRLVAIATLVLVTSMTVACGGHHLRQVHGELPTIDLDSLTRLNDRIQVDVGIHNLNDSPLEIASIRIELAVNEQAPIELINDELTLTIGARGREVIRLSGRGNDSLQDNLDLLASAERMNLPWSMAVSLGRSGRSDRETEASGYLHSMPGQPDRFR